MNEFHSTLLKMGYREIKAQTWAKPVGFVLFLYEEDKNTFFCFFKNMKDKISLWSSTTYNSRLYTSFLYYLKKCEAYSKIDLCPSSNSEFEFISLNQIEELL